MTENLLTKNPMDEDLLSENPMGEDLLRKIQRETHERLHELRGAVDEHDRLQTELSALDTASEPAVAPEVVAEPLAALHTDSELPAAPEAAPEPPVAHEPSANVVRLPTTPRLPRTRMVSPKVARLMRAPRRPALERAGVVRVGAGGDSAQGSNV